MMNKLITGRFFTVLPFYVDLFYHFLYRDFVGSATLLNNIIFSSLEIFFL